MPKIVCRVIMGSCSMFGTERLNNIVYTYSETNGFFYAFGAYLYDKQRRQYIIINSLTSFSKSLTEIIYIYLSTNPCGACVCFYFYLYYFYFFF